MERLRVAGRVGVERVAVVEGERLPGLLVLGEVPASGELGLQSLRTRRRRGRFICVAQFDNKAVQSASGKTTKSITR